MNILLGRPNHNSQNSPDETHELGSWVKKWDDVLWVWTMGFNAFLCKYGLFWVLEEILPKSMIVLTWCRLPMKWSHVVWKICSQQWATRPVKRRQASSDDEIEMTRDQSRGRRWRDLNYMIWSAISAVWFGVRAVVQFGVVIFPISFTPETNTALV